jgi:hypothetical protein
MENLKYYDSRTGSSYTVVINERGQFEHALRYAGRIGFDAIRYDRLEDVPEPYRSDIVTKVVSN